MQSTNPVMSDPNRDRVQEMFRHLELGVAIEIFMSETALECDIVLPETSFYEHAEIRNGMWLGPEVILCQPAVAPVGESKPLYEIVKGIATKMGWGQHFPYEKWEDWGELMLKDIPISLDELKQKGFWAGPVRYNRVPEGLATPSGKVEIRSQAYADAGFDPYPIYTERTVKPDADFPLQLTHSKLSMHCNIVTQNNPFLMEICGENWMEINRVDAVKYGIVDGDLRHRRVAEGPHPHQGARGRGAGPRLHQRAPRPRLRPLGDGFGRQGQGSALEQPHGHPHQPDHRRQLLQRVQGARAPGGLKPARTARPRERRCSTVSTSITSVA